MRILLVISGQYIPVLSPVHRGAFLSTLDYCDNSWFLRCHGTYSTTFIILIYNNSNLHLVLVYQDLYYSFNCRKSQPTITSKGQKQQKMPQETNAQ